MTKDELAQDLAYVRTLAEEGRHAPLIGGSFLVFFGVLLAVAYALHWSLLTGRFGSIGGNEFWALWGGYCVLAFVGVALLRKRTRRLPGGSSMVNRVDGAVWWSAGFAIMVVVFGCIGRMLLHQDYYAPNAIMPSAYAMFGFALAVTATIANQGWMRIFSMLSFAASIALWITMNEPWAYLLAAAAAVVVLILPGVLMVRNEATVIV